MGDDSLNYPLVPPWTVDPGFPPSHKPLYHWLDRFFIFYFLFFVLNPRIHDSPASQMSLLQSASLLQPHIRPTTHPPWPNQTRGFRLFAVFSFSRRVFPPFGTYAPIPTVAALMHYLITLARRFALSAPPSIWALPLAASCRQDSMSLMGLLSS